MPVYTRVILTRGETSEEWWEDREFLPALSVDAATMEFTGILDADGNPIFKHPRPIGFGRENEW